MTNWDEFIARRFREMTGDADVGDIVLMTMDRTPPHFIQMAICLMFREQVTALTQRQRRDWRDSFSSSRHFWKTNAVASGRAAVRLPVPPVLTIFVRAFLAGEPVLLGT